MKENLIQEMAFKFALDIVKLYSLLRQSNEHVLANQLLRSGTSIWANVEEAIAWQTKKDFISKMSIASKEARESRYWLRLLSESKITTINFESYLKDAESIINVLTKIVKTTTENIKK